MIDFSLTEEQILLQKTARDFAQREVKPVAAEYDKKQDPAAAVIPWNHPIYQKASQLGLGRIMLPEELGGADLGCLGLVIALEEFAAADAGFAVVINNCNQMTLSILNNGSEELRKWLLKELASLDLSFAMSIMEPDAGGVDQMYVGPDRDIGITTYARRDKNGDYILNGTKAAFCTNAGQAEYYLILARTDLNKPAWQSSTMFFVPADTPGFTVGKVTPRLGWRCVAQAELYLDDVRVPEEYRIGDEGKGMEPSGFGLPNASASTVLGIGRAAFEYALDYAKQRKTWGQRMINHTPVSMLLAEMQMQIEAARLLVWRAAWLNDIHRDPNSKYYRVPYYHSKTAMSKLFAAEAALWVSEKAIEIMGCYGTSQELPVEKCLRDAMMLKFACGSRNMKLLEMATEL